MALSTACGCARALGRRGGRAAASLHARARHGRVRNDCGELRCAARPAVPTQQQCRGLAVSSCSQLPESTSSAVAASSPASGTYTSGPRPVSRLRPVGFDSPWDQPSGASSTSSPRRSRCASSQLEPHTVPASPPARIPTAACVSCLSRPPLDVKLDAACPADAPWSAAFRAAIRERHWPRAGEGATAGVDSFLASGAFPTAATDPAGLVRLVRRAASEYGRLPAELHECERRAGRVLRGEQTPPAFWEAAHDASDGSQISSHRGFTPLSKKCRSGGSIHLRLVSRFSA